MRDAAPQTRASGRATRGQLPERGRRGLTSVFQYVQVVFMIALLISGLLYGFGEVVLDQRERAVRSNLAVLGHRVADGFATADRLALEGDDPTVAVRLELPRQVAGVRYDLAIVSEGDTATVVLETHRPPMTVRVTFRTRVPLRESSVGSGPVTVRYDSAADVLEVVGNA